MGVSQFWGRAEFKQGYVSYREGIKRKYNPHKELISTKLWFAGWDEAWLDDK